MGVEIDKNDFDEDHFVFNNEDFSKDDILGDKLSDYQIIQIIDNDREKTKFIAKVLSKKNSKLYILKKINYTVSKDDMDKEFEILTNLKNNNIVKYYRWFNDNGNIYIIKECYNCDNLVDIVNGYNSINKTIEVKLLWNILWQCLSGLKYLHEKNIIHKNIYKKNILLTENKIVKLNNIKYSFLKDDENKIKTKSDDIYDLSQSLKFLINSQKYNSNEIKDFENIINLMEKDYPNLTAEILLKKLNENYIHNIFKFSSIISIFRCLSCFQRFTNDIQKNRDNLSEDDTPLSFHFLKCLDNLSYNGDNNELNKHCYNLRNILYKENELNFDNEFNPIKILGYIMEIFHKETNKVNNGPSFGLQEIISNPFKPSALEQFKNYFNQNYNSIITQYFITTLKTKRICNKCNSAHYFFNSFPYIEFDMDMYDINIPSSKKYDLNNLEDWFYVQNNQYKIISKEYNIYCEYCKTNMEHREFKQIYFLPKYFIINLNRGKNYLNKFQFEIKMELNLNNNVEDRNSYFKFNLVGIIKRFFDDKNGEYFVAFYKGENNIWKKYNSNNENKVSNILNPNVENEGQVVILFYYAVE